MGTQNQRENAFITKRCPECATELPVDAIKCTDCGKRVGDVDRLGRAKRPIDWWAYTACALSWLAFALYIWWAFFRE